MDNEDLVMLDRISSAINAAVVAELERRELLVDRDYWKEKYQDLLSSSIKDAQQTTEMLMSAVLAGCVISGKKDSDGH